MGKEMAEQPEVISEEQPGSVEDFLKFKLSRPVDYQQIHIEELDLSGIRDLNLTDLEEVYETYAATGGDKLIMQESTIGFAKTIAARTTGLPLELFGAMNIKDAFKLKNRVYRFFFLEA